jgi:hypothetical protein
MELAENAAATMAFPIVSIIRIVKLLYPSILIVSGIVRWWCNNQA